MVESRENSGLSIWFSQPYFMTGTPLKGAVLLDTSVNPGEEITLYFRGFNE